MLTRRGFLSALCALPFVGKFMPKPDRVVDRQSGMSIRFVEKWDIIPDSDPFHVDFIPCDKGPHCLCPWHQGLREMSDRWDQRAFEHVFKDLQMSKDGGKTWFTPQSPPPL